MGAGAHAGVSVVLAAMAVILAFFPRSLFAEAAGGAAPSRRQEALLAAGLLAVGIAAFMAWREGDAAQRLAFAIALMALAGIIVADLRYLTIPDLYSGAVAVTAFFGPLFDGVMQALGGAALCGGLLGIVAWVWKRRTAVEGIGFGDVKLAAAIGLLLGPQWGILAISASATAGAVVGLILQARRKDEDGPMLFPYGAPLALAGAVFLIVGAVR